MSWGRWGGHDDDLRGLGGSSGGARPPQYPALPPDEAETALGALRRRGVSALGYVGSVLDKFGGRAVRGSLDALMGKGGSRELLSLIPFSDTLGLTNPADVEAHRGSQLLKHAFHYDPEQAQGHWGAWAERNILGPAVELGLDPSTYLGGAGALTRSGAAAAKLGRVPALFEKGYVGALRSGERTLVHGLTGQPAAAIAEAGRRGAEATNDLLRRIPGVKEAEKWATDTALSHWQSWTDPTRGWIPNKGIQAAYKAIRHPQLAGLERHLNEEYARMRLVEGQLVDEGVKRTGMDAPTYTTQLHKYLNQAWEGVDPSYHDAPFVAALPPAAHDLADQLRQMGATRPKVMEQGAGLRTKELGDIIDYAMHVRNPLYDRNAPGGKMAAQAAKKAKLLQTAHPSMTQRLQGTTGYAGGVEELQDIIGQHAGIKPGDPGWQAVQGGPHVPDFLRGAVAGQEGLAPGAPFSVNPHSPWVKEAAGFIGSVDPQRLINPKTKLLEPYFVRDPIQMAMRRGMMGAEVTTSARTITHALGTLAKPVADFGPDEAKMSVYDVLKKSGMHGPQGVLNTANELGIDANDVLSHMHQTGITDMHAARRDLLKQHAIDAKTGNELTQLLSRGGPAPYELQGIEKWGRAMLGGTKNALYTTWLSSHVRNLTTGRLQALIEAGVNPWTKDYKLGRTILRNPTTLIDPGIKGVKDSQQLLTEAFADRIVDAHAGELAANLPEKMKVQEYAKNPFTPRPTLQQGVGEAWQRVKTGPVVNPIGEKGALVQLGHATNTIVENDLRLGQYINMRRRGFSREVARDRVFQTHFDYTRGTGAAAQRFMQNAFIFPTFTYHNVPKQLRLAATSPARVSGPLRFAGGGMGDEEGYVPKYLQGGLNFPIPASGLPEGTTRFLTSLGTPMEEAFGHLKTGTSAAGTLINTGQNLMGMVRPDVKAALEVLSNTQFHTGRKLSELDAGKLAALAPVIGEDAVTLLYQAISGSPLSRVGSTAQMLTDPRKMTPVGATLSAARLLTGVKSSDVNVPLARDRDERDLITGLMGRSRNIRSGSYYYVPQANQANLTDRERQLMQLFNTIEKKARERRALQQNAQFGNP